MYGHFRFEIHEKTILALAVGASWDGPQGQPWPTDRDFQRLDAAGLAGGSVLFPAWLLARIQATIAALPPRLGWQTRNELEDILRAERQRSLSDDGMKDWTQSFAARIAKVSEEERKFLRLDYFSGLRPSNIDRAETLKAAIKMSASFGGCQDEDFARGRMRGYGLDTSNIQAGGLLPRLKDIGWWKKTLRRNLRERCENAARIIDARKVKWCSQDGMDDRRESDKAAELWAAMNVFQSDDGRVFQCPSPQETARKKYAELMVRVRGIVNLSCSGEACLLTVTCPSHFHPCTTQNGRKLRNEKWDGSTPRDAHQWLKARWARMRAALKRRGMGRHFLQTRQPHEDGTVHAHTVFLCDSEEFSTIEMLARRYFFGGGEHQVDFRALDDTVHGAKYVSRALQYISRSTSGGDDDEEATATKQWASTWGIRRFSTSQSAVTAYRLARRDDVLPESNPLRQAAAAGDYSTFILLYEAGEGQLITRAVKNRYGEEEKRVIGLACACGGGVKKINWKIKRTVSLMYQGGEAPKPQKPEHQVIFDPPPTLQ